MRLFYILLFTTIPIILLGKIKSNTAYSKINTNQIPELIVVKVKNEFRYACFQNRIQNIDLEDKLRSLNFIYVRKKFPSAKKPQTEYNLQKRKLADISLIYEIAFEESTPIKKVVSTLNSLNIFEYVEPVYTSHILYTPNDANLNNVLPYHYSKISVYDAWDTTKGDTSVIIGITDTSFDIDHEDLKDNIKYNYSDPIGNGDEDEDSYIDNFAGWDLVDNNNNLFINNEIHGNAVAAISSASADNNIGFAGIGFNCKFLPIKIANNEQVITKGYEGIVYAVEHGASVINCSWGNTTYSQAAQDVITYAAINNDAVIVAAAGNTNTTDFYYPASYNHVLSVTGVDANDVYSNGTNTPFTRNDSVDVCAPGFNIYTTATYNGVALYDPPQNGTSMATPIVSGIAGLIRSKFPCLTSSEVIERITSTTDSIYDIAQNTPFIGKLGTGRINALKAVTGNPCSSVGIINTEKNEDKLQILINQTSGSVVVKVNNTDPFSYLQIINTTGKIIFEEKTIKNNNYYLNSLPSGVYLAIARNKTKLNTKRFVIVE